MKILLAPMEGVIDHHMREALTALGGYDGCVTEFVRITEQRQPARVFKRLSPELLHNGHTPSGIPVTVQLLGGNPQMMAANAEVIANLGAPAIDINFGCPSRMVTSKTCGSALLQYPEQLHDIVAAVRQAVDAAIPVSAKMRLGYQDDSLALENALAIESAGACELTVHARTRVEGYKPPARWEALAPLREALTIPLIANGDIRTLDDYRRCVEASGCHDVMLGRGALVAPLLAKQIKQSHHGEVVSAMAWHEITTLILKTSEGMEQEYPQKYVVMRIKQWLAYLRGEYPEGQKVFDLVRRMTVLEDVLGVLGSRM